MHDNTPITLSATALVLQEDGGQHVDLLAWLTASAGSSFSQPSERQLWLSTAQGRFALRLVTAALPPAAAERARQRVRTKAQLRRLMHIDNRGRFQ